MTKEQGKQKIIAEFRRIPGVGKSIAQDFWDIGLRSLNDLKKANPDLLYKALCDFKGCHVDHCMLYVFRCAVYFASETHHDPELLKWWNWKDTVKN